MEKQLRVLFLCTGNSSRSQMAEGLLRQKFGDQFEALSAGSRPAGFVHPLAIAAMSEIGADLSAQRSKSVQEFLPPEGTPPDVLIALCASAARECPSFPAGVRRLDWPLDDPGHVTGTPEECLDAFRRTREQLRAAIEGHFRGNNGNGKAGPQPQGTRVELRDVAKSHHLGATEVRALRGVTAEIPAGSFTFIVGPSGSGKSSLLYLIGALDEPSSGEILVGGRRLNGFTTQERDRYRREEVGFVFQSFNLLANLTAVENVLVPFMPRGISHDLRARAIQLLKDVGLSNRLDHRPNQLSGGEQQRVAIARAILKRPKLVLADEPTGELDSATGAEVFGHLRRLHEDLQTTVVVVTHDQRYLTDSDNVLRLQDGKLADGI
ncbi:MAG TPA: ATP-binding cassette domain-containing protein [Planctomycetaceae bacterium]|nr:ATP-binding cassette domain-containing protein [Planctomycetaceae bacterium]